MPRENPRGNAGLRMKSTWRHRPSSTDPGAGDSRHSGPCERGGHKQERTACGCRTDVAALGEHSAVLLEGGDDDALVHGELHREARTTSRRSNAYDRDWEVLRGAI